MRIRASPLIKTLLKTPHSVGLALAEAERPDSATLCECAVCLKIYFRGEKREHTWEGQRGREGENPK